MTSYREQEIASSVALPRNDINGERSFLFILLLGAKGAPGARTVRAPGARGN